MAYILILGMKVGMAYVSVFLDKKMGFEELSVAYIRFFGKRVWLCDSYEFWKKRKKM